jgi:tetratricopeptide (TPR) repeat protein
MFNSECQVRVKPFLLTILLLIFASAFTSCLFGGKERFVSRGEEYLKKRRFQEAALEFRSAIQADKDFAPAHWGLARAFEGSGYISETTEELHRTVDLDPAHVAARAKLGNYLLTENPPQIDETRQLLESIFTIDQNNIEGHVLKASLLAAQRKPEQEIEDALNYAISLDTNRIETYLSAARYFYKAKKNEKAEQVLNNALIVNPNSAAAYMEYGKYFDYTERAPEAEAKYQKAIESESANLEARELLAQFYYNHNEYDKAETAYKELVEVQGNIPEARASLAGFYMAIDREDDAINVYEGILADAPEFVFARYQLSEIYLERGDMDKVMVQVKELLGRDDKDIQALMLRARMHLQDGNTDDSIKDLEEVLRRAPNYKEALFYMTDAKIRTGQIDHARTYISDLERYHPKFMQSRLLKIQASFAADEANKAFTESNELMAALKDPALNNETSPQEIERLNVAAMTSRGLASMRMRNFAAAQSDLEYVRQLSPSSPGAHMNLGRLALAMNDPAQANALYEKALTLGPDNFDALTGLINVMNGQRQFAAAHQRIDKAMLNNGPQTKMLPALFFLKAQTFAAEGNSDAAEAEFLKAIETDKNYLPAYSAYASLLMDKQQVDRALEQYQKILAVRPSDSATYTLIGVLEDGRNNSAAAENNYRKALELNPEMPIAANNLAWVISESDQGNMDEALQFAKAAVEKVPNNPAFYDTLGWVYHKKGLQGPAIENLKKAVAMEAAQSALRGRQPNPAYNLRLGIALAALGDKQSARKEVEIALRNEKDLSNNDAQNAKSLLETL